MFPFQYPYLIFQYVYLLHGFLKSIEFSFQPYPLSIDRVLELSQNHNATSYNQRLEFPLYLQIQRLHVPQPFIISTPSIPLSNLLKFCINKFHICISEFRLGIKKFRDLTLRFSFPTV